MYVLNCRKWLVWPLLGLALSVWPIACDYISIIEKFGAEAVASCNEKCPFQNRTGDGHFDLSCGTNCTNQQCTLGCSLWNDGLENSCQTSCNVTSESVLSRELYCVIGCNEALNTYFQKLRELIGIPPPPALVADTISPTSLSLVWEAPSVENLRCVVQWRYEELPATWHYYSGLRADSHIIHLHTLKPYTKYRFRVAIFLSGRTGPSAGEPIFSAPSVVISTLESGPPSSPPASVRATAPDPTRIAVSWQSGQFANGPLIGYVLRLSDVEPNVYSALKDMPASNNTLFYMFQNLSPSRHYEISVSMRNAVGEGPRSYVRVDTPAMPTSIRQQPILILGGEQSVLAAPANDMLSDPVELYTSDYNITGIGIDVTSDYLFVSVSAGYIYRTSLSKKSKSIPIITPDMAPYTPLDLSVDWLNRHLYILGEVYHNKSQLGANLRNWEILRCDFDGRNQLVALGGFNSRPMHFEVDPYNGYLFWVLRGVDKGGLYRLDLANISNGVRHDAPPEWIVKDAHLGPFTVDHAAFRILVAHLRKNNILAVSLDGAEVSDFRSNTQTPQFSSARWLAYAQGLFYWSAGARLLAEEYHAATDSYFHNEYPLEYPRNKHTTTQVLVNLRSCQPLPVPVNPPRGVAAVLGPVGARVCWEAPSRLPPQGLGAPPQWRYRLQATPTTHTAYIYRENINGTSIVINGLDPDTEYVIKVAAVSESGTGPWSSEFVGRTLDTSPATSNSTLVWSTHDGLMESDLTGDRLRVLLHSSELNQTQITSISWYLDKFYLVTNESTVLWLNTTTGRSGVLSTLDQVACVAIDWLGKRLYWSNPKQQLISRGTLDGTNREPVPIVTVALEMLIDAPEARLYWNTGHAVEAGSLQGEHRMVYYPAQLFSGRQVMGITIDLENRWLYWLVRSYDGSELHRALTAERLTEDAKQLGETLVNRVSFETGGPLTYIHGKMVWGSSGAISDPRAKHHAILREGTALAGKDPTVQANAESLIAIPEMVDASSIKVIGNWSRFGVTWTPDTRVYVNRSQLLYDVTMQCGNIVIERTVSGPPCWSPTLVPAHSRVLVSIRAHGGWGAAPSVSVRATTPPAPPRPPTHPRLYLHTLGEGILATFRWEPPSQSNGVILGYETKCWVVPDPNKTVSSHLTANSQAAGNKAVVSSRSSACADASLPPSSRQLVLRDRKPSGIYYFQVRAFTEAGYGPYSDITSASSHDPTPIPKVIISSQDAIRILDLDSGDGETIPKSTGIPVDFDVSFEENVVYWVNNLEEIFSSRINGSGHYKILSINGSASSMCTEWISGSLYWSQAEGSSHVTYTAPVTAHGTATARLTPVRLFQTENAPLSMRVVPLKRTLYWYEETSHFGFGTLMTSKSDGGDVKPFFNQSIENRDECNCPDNPQIAKTFTIDMTSNNYEIYWVDPWQHQIIATDLQSCKCRVVVDATEKKKYGFTPMSIAVDSKYVYWFNSTERIIYYANKNKKSKIEYVKSSYGYKILAFDSLNQPYPPLTCLYPESERLIPEIIDTKAYSISLHLPTIEKVKQCSNFEFDMPLSEYTVFYKEKGEDIVCDKMVCQYIVSVDQEVTINDLKPFTNYSVTVEATNYYAKLHLIKPIVGEVIVLQTAAEAPTPATDVSATVLSPFIARVEWTPAPGLWYEVHWQTDHATGSLQHKFKEHNTFEVSEGRAANMTRLSPDTSYSVWVRARSNYSSERVDSDVVRVKTYPLPPDVVLDNATAFELRVLWNPPVEYRIYRYKVEYTEISVTPPVWLVAKPEANSKWIASELQPATRYKFRLTLQYLRQAPTTHWPHDERFTFETLATVPSEPGVAIAEALGGRAVRARWAPAQPRGAAVDLYRVWGRPTESNSSNSTGNATEVSRNIPDDVDDELRERILREGVELLYNGTENYWVIGSWELGGSWEVWAQAHNAAGWGGSGPPGRLAPPAPSAPPAPPAPSAPTTSAPALSAALAAALLLTIAVTAHAASVYKNRNKKKTSLVEHPLTLPTSRPDVELAILRQLPIGHFNNVIYNQGLPYPTDAELASLPHIRREQITLNKFLGSGAFGEVFEGVARGLADSTADTKVAVKTLRKGATDQEKAEFLQEAALMSNFKHSHILRLLGVCLDNDPHYIIMELMEGGDLLSYLRTKRSSLYTPESLTLLDLLNMCVDVTKGCRYLEEMHFVHRDLAARNCLVAHRPGGRIVKIGDFGLARDIYKNDYYRKEGEGLLPVRWMAVECLVDGVFSCQSDVWAWGVTCWEILSLGNQPYPLATNRQVLALVRAGGAPTHPPNCPTQLYDLLKRCWNYRPEARPTFKECLQVVTELRDKTSPNITLTGTAAHHAYLTVLPSDAVENRTYLLDENGNTFIDEDIPEDQQSLEQSRTLPQPTPKYLELMYGPESISSGAPSDGYEIPRLPLNRAFLPQSRHSIVGIAPNRLIKPPLYRTHSLRTNPKPTATITPLRNGLPKRASLCEDTGLTLEPEASSSRTEHNNKTQF